MTTSALQDAAALVGRAHECGLRVLGAAVADGSAAPATRGAEPARVAARVDELAAQLRGLAAAGYLGSVGGAALVADLETLAGALRGADPAAIRPATERVGDAVRRIAAGLVTRPRDVIDGTDGTDGAGASGIGTAKRDRSAAIAHLQVQEAVYRSAIAATGRVVPAGLAEFLR